MLRPVKKAVWHGEMNDPTQWTPEEKHRYARHFSIPGFGEAAQAKLRAARVLVIGLGGLGSPVAMYLAAAGVGTLRLVDADVVELSNLQRQTLHGQSQLGQSKLASAAHRLHDLNSEVELELIAETFRGETARELAAGCDVIVDGTDNFPTRYLSNDVAVWAGIPNVYGSILRFDGQVSVFAPHLGGPCYRCMAPQPPPPGAVPTCAEGGVLGALPGIIGSIQALEAIKLITQVGEPLVGRLLHFDTLTMKTRTFTLRRDPECAVCGTHPSITEPIDYHGFCGLPSSPSPNMNSLTVTELHSLRENGDAHFLLDVRQPDEWETCHIAGALLIPLGELADRVDELPRDRRLIVHCKAGGRSARAVAYLMEQGFTDVWNVEGGMDAWQRRHS
jgi:sulfur-carrier protein adenylyltransferase/sulfurtransferase